MEMYSIYDRKLRSYGGILLSPNQQSVTRDVQVGVADSGSLMEKFPEDFELHRVGYFDRDLGTITPVDSRPEVVGQLADIVKGIAHGQ